MNNPLAFPIISEANEHVIATGMTMRDYFAAKAMQGFAADPNTASIPCIEIASLAYQWADAMLAERDK